MIQTLKLLSLLSLTQDGIPSREYKSLKKQYLQLPWLDKPKDDKIGICCFSARHAALRSKSKD
jgi:hypothetical protein